MKGVCFFSPQKWRHLCLWVVSGIAGEPQIQPMGKSGAVSGKSEILENPFEACQKMIWVEVPGLEVKRRHQSVRSRDPTGADQGFT